MAGISGCGAQCTVGGDGMTERLQKTRHRAFRNGGNDGRIYKKYYGADPLCEGTGSRGKGAVRSYSGPGGGL